MTIPVTTDPAETRSLMRVFFERDVSAAYLAATGQAIPFVFGELSKHKNEQSAPPRYLVLRRRGGHVSGPTAATNPRDATPTVGWIAEVFAVQCWGATEAQAETLWRNICSLLKSLAPGAGGAVLGPYDWLTEQERRASHVTNGVVIEQLVTFQTDVPDQPVPTVVLDTEHYHTTVIGTGTEDGCGCDSPP